MPPTDFLVGVTLPPSIHCLTCLQAPHLIATMPSFFRPRTPSPTGIHIGTSSPVKTVAFPSGLSPVTSVSRQLSNEELWILYHFESHARLCSACLDPYAVHKAHRRLCSLGHRLAQAVARIIYSKHNGRDVFEASRSRDQNPVKVELPCDYEEIRSLLRAMERSLRHRHQRPIASLDSDSYSQQLSRRVFHKNAAKSSEDHKTRRDSPKRSLSLRSSPKSSPSRSDRRKPEIIESAQSDVTHELRVPPSSWRQSISLVHSFPPYNATSTPPRQTTQSQPAANTQDAARTTPEQGSKRSPSTSTTSSKSSTDTRRRSTQGVAASAARYSAMISSTASAEAKKISTSPLREADRRSMAPAPEVPTKQPKPSARPKEDSRRVSWHGGVPYTTELREPKAANFDRAEKKARRYSTLFF